MSSVQYNNAVQPDNLMECFGHQKHKTTPRAGGQVCPFEHDAFGDCTSADLKSRRYSNEDKL